MSLSLRLSELIHVIAGDIASLEKRNGSSNIIHVETTVVAESSYVVMDTLEVNAALVIDGKVGVL